MAGPEGSGAIKAKGPIMSELTTAEAQRDLPAMQADLVDLLQLEFDALPVYALAIARLRRPEFRETLRLFRTDHERHVQDLSAEIRRLGGIPLPIPHLPTGLLKLGVQLAGLGGDDRTILLAFVSNEWQSQEKYARYAALPYPPDVASLLQRHARDEARHFAWACGALQELGCGTDTPVGRMVQAFARFHGTTADVVEAAGHAALEAMARVSRPA
jgi:rubrerythrin